MERAVIGYQELEFNKPIEASELSTVVHSLSANSWVLFWARGRYLPPNINNKNFHF